MPSRTRRTPSNREIADMLDEIGLMLDAEGVKYKPEAYEIAAQTVRGLDEELAKMYRACGKKCVDALPGLGESITNKVAELVTTGRLREYETMKKRYPMDLLDLTRVEGIGPKTAVKLSKILNIKTLVQLEAVAKKPLTKEIKGFTEKTRVRVLRQIEFLRQGRGRVLLHQAVQIAEEIVEAMKRTDTVGQVAYAGSARRMQETVGDIDLIATSTDIKKALTAFRTLPQVSKLIEEWPDRSFVRLANGLDADIIVVKPEQFGSVLLHFTGDKQHNIKIRTLAEKKGMKLTEYGLFKGKKVVASKTEAEIYKGLGMQMPPPEIRTDSGEVEAARAGKLPEFIGYDEIQGDLQVQTDWTDGTKSIKDMAEAARKRGRSYIAITDHTQSLAMMGGLDPKKLAAQGKEIDALNKKYKDFRILKSTECDILKDGKLDLPDTALKTLDLVCVSVHSHRNLPEAEMTERVIRALKNPLVNVLFHPTGRIVARREPYAIDMGKVIRAAKEYGVALEVNASDRLDLKDAHIREAVKLGVKLVIDSDAHMEEEYDFLRFGIAQARRGWATKDDVLNTKPVDAFLKAIRALKK